jgi:pyruvate dehydrogenase E1 component alpha subunit
LARHVRAARVSCFYQTNHHLQVLPAKSHRIEAPPNVVETSVDELLRLYELMYKMRRMEIAADMMYKAKLIRGFCHL